jgi:hypothetical protein
MDVEGAESLVLAGATTLLSERDCVWFAALHGDTPARTSAALFRKAGYRVRDLRGHEASDASVGSLEEVYATRR